MTVRIEHPLHENAYIYKQKDSKNWFMDYKNANGKRTRKTSGTDDKREAFRILSENIILIKKIKSGEIILADDQGINVKKAVAMTIAYFEKQEDQRAAYKVYLRVLKDFSERYGNLPIKSINGKVLRDFLSQNWGEKTLSMNKTALNMMFTLAEEADYIDYVPEFPKNIPVIPSKKREGLKKEQVIAIINRFREKSILIKHPSSRRKARPVEKENARIMALLITVLYKTGARVGEVRYLTPNRLWQEKMDDKTFAFMDIQESKTKTRKILIPYSLYFYLKDYQESFGIKDDGFYFKNRVNGKINNDFSKVLTRDYQSNKDFYDEIGVKNLCLYRFRHTFIINRLLVGKNIVMCAQHCGTSTHMIEKYYSSYIVASSYKNIYTDQSDSFLDDDGSILTAESLAIQSLDINERAKKINNLLETINE